MVFCSSMIFSIETLPFFLSPPPKTPSDLSFPSPSLSIPSPLPSPKQLAHLYLAHGQRWAEIARHLEGRTDQQCMGRWRRHLDPSVKKDAWAVGEDETLMCLHDSLGPRWSNISKMLTGRTAQQCRARWFQLSAVEDDGAQSTEGSDSETDGATVVVVTTRDDDEYKPRGKYASENLSPSTPSVTDEHGTVTISFGASMKPETSRKRNGVGAVSEKGAWNVGVKRARKTVTKDAAGGSGDTNENSPEDFSGHGQGSGLDMLAMLYSAAVSYEQAMGAASAGVPLATHSEELTTLQTNAALTHSELHA